MLRISGHNYSPAVLDKAVTAGGDCKSFKHGSRQMKKLAEVSISATHLARLTHEIGHELVEKRDRLAELHRYRQLPADPDQPPVDLACAEVDGGRLLTRAAEQPRGVHDEQWKEPKVGVLWRMTGETFEEDPHPELPRCFQDRERVPKLVRDVHGGRTGGRTDGSTDHGITHEEITGQPVESEAVAEADEIPVTEEAAAAKEAAANEAISGTPPAPREPEHKRWQPKRVFRTCVVTMRDVHGFGPLLAAEAQQRGFYQAKRKAFIADGQEANWTVQRLHFPDFTPITDFMHAVGYSYAAVQAMTEHRDDLWPRYLQAATACWQGRVDEVIAELEAWLAEHPLPEGVPLKDISDTDASKIVHTSLTYFRNNRERMDYSRYRRQGMPVTSSLVESLIKEINWRVKGTEKFWNRSEEPTSPRTGRPVRGRQRPLPAMCAETILQIRAALLCDDNRLEKHILTRPGSPFTRRSSPDSAVCPV